MEGDENFLQCVIFSDSVSRIRYYNRHSLRIWGLENPYSVLKQARKSPKLNMGCSLLHN